ncbi:MAG: hypothetical protein OWR52_05935 [Acidibacillus sp.]|uniref:Uncharacterized protein n=1 Tax=Sulfoacidibacillus ferrooxidans TaxID=2005001 RepID=A0A9X1VAJ0_9BACL|nr:hypothetical protein [Sulfoacidibacillus ferrooxidans]MCI0184112.1 hypothetical protein [Sulfoacidibacillus ferrooxidans]MCY0893026.1 hypothetical protein [Acidibacillus sp.]
MKVFYHKNKFAVSGRAHEVRHWIRILQSYPDATLAGVLAERTIAKRVHSFVIREYVAQ